MVKKRAGVNRIKGSRQDHMFILICTILLTLFLMVTLYPLIHVVSASFSSGEAVSQGKVILWPVDLSVEGFEAVFRNKNVLNSYKNTIIYTAVGTAVNVFVALIAAYPMSRKNLPGKSWLMVFFTFTMYFGGGLIPSYILNRLLGLIDSMWVLILPGALSVYNMILTRTFLQSSIPDELLDAARIDGCSDAKYFFKIILPLSKAIIAVLSIYAMVGHWNSYFDAMLYLNSVEKMPLQIILKQILVANQITSDMMVDPEYMEARAELADVLKYALIVVSTAPIMAIYPFAQKYFVQGVMIGSLKG